MNKKLIALAVAGALGAPLVASAQGTTGVTLSGRVQAEYGSTRIDQAGANNFRQESIADNPGASRWAMLITEDLGNGLKANAKIDFGFRTGNGVVENAREQWVGLSSKTWGEDVVALLDALDMSEWDQVDLADPVEWVRQQREEQAKQRGLDWGNEA